MKKFYIVALLDCLFVLFGVCTCVYVCVRESECVFGGFT